MASRNPLPEPIVIDRFWKNRRKDAVIIQLSSYEGHNLVDLRTHSMSSDGKLLPTKKGLAVSILRLPELAKAVNKALARARELGLVDDGAGAA
jgi:hypothetical protein